MFLCLTCKADEACLNFMALTEDDKFRIPCPNKGCDGELLLLDDGIAEAIVLLNEKGYVTKDSCSGHFNNCEGRNSFYVAFASGKNPPDDELPCEFMLLPGVPVGLDGDAIWYVGLGPPAIGPGFPADVNRTLEVLRINTLFLEWVLELPSAVSTAPVPGRANEEGSDA